MGTLDGVVQPFNATHLRLQLQRRPATSRPRGCPNGLTRLVQHVSTMASHPPQVAFMGLRSPTPTKRDRCAHPLCTPTRSLECALHDTTTTADFLEIWPISTFNHEAAARPLVSRSYPKKSPAAFAGGFESTIQAAIGSVAPCLPT